MNTQPFDALFNRELLADLAQSVVPDDRDLWPRIERSVRDLQRGKTGFGAMRRNVVVAFGSLVAVGVLVVVLVSPGIMFPGGVDESEESPGTSNKPRTSVDMAFYSSIEQLSAASDLVVLGTAGEVVAREIDYGTSDPDERQGQGIPTVFYRAAVTETLRGQAGATVIVAAPDVEEVSMGGQATALRSGQQVLLFLKEQTANDAPGITAYDHFYVTVNLDNGVFDRVGDDSVQPRMSEAFEAVRFSLEEVRGKVQR